MLWSLSPREWPSYPVPLQAMQEEFVKLASVFGEKSKIVFATVEDVFAVSSVKSVP